jgi:hypothetical protein
MPSGRETVVVAGQKSESTPENARWPFVLLYLFTWAGMVGMSLNSDPIKLDYSVGVVLGLLSESSPILH